MSPNFRHIGQRLGVLRPRANPELTNPPFIGTTEQENNSLPPNLAQSFGYIEINYCEGDEYDKAA